MVVDGVGGATTTGMMILILPTLCLCHGTKALIQYQTECIFIRLIRFGALLLWLLLVVVVMNGSTRTTSTSSSTSSTSSTSSRNWGIRMLHSVFTGTSGCRHLITVTGDRYSRRHRLWCIIMTTRRHGSVRHNTSGGGGGHRIFHRC